MKFALIEAEKAAFPVTVLCEVLEVSRSGFYAWQARPPSARATEDARLKEQVRAIHAKSQKRYGSPRVHRVLRRKGIRVSPKRVARVMREEGIEGLRKRRYKVTTNSKHGSPIAPNLLERDFEPEGPNKSWAGDVTAIATGEGWVYLAVLLDLFSRRVVGWAMSPSNDTNLALDALRSAVKCRRTLLTGLVHHTDRGSPYASAEYRAALESLAIVQSMSRKGDCWDNAVSESFFASLRAELVDHETYSTARAAEGAIGEFIDRFYNFERLHSHNDFLSPVEFELNLQLSQIAS